MSYFIVEEGRFWLYSVVLGVGITALYDCLRIFRRVFRHGIFWISVEDLLYWTAVSVCAFSLLYYENDGAVRWFAILGAALGMLLFKKTVSPFLVHYSSAFLLWLNGLLRKAAVLLTRPFCFAGKAVKKSVGQNMAKIRRKAGQLARIFKKQLTVRRRMIKINLWKRCRKIPRGE